VPAALAPTFGDGLDPGGNAAAFTGTGDVFTINRSIQDEFSILLWVRADTPGIGGDLSQFFEGSGVVYADIGGVANDFGTALTGTKFAFGIGNPDTTIHSTTDVSTDRWTFIAVVRRIDPAASRTDLRLYVDGVLEESATHANIAPLDAQALITIGGNTIDSRFFIGRVDELALFGVALDEAAIQTIFAAYTGITPCFTATPAEGPVPLAVSFDAACSTSTGAALTTFAWDLGNGETPAGRQVTTAYSSPGLYAVRLQATNADGVSARTSTVVKALFASGDVTPWTSRDVGVPLLPGGARLDGGCLTVFTSGQLIIGQADDLHFVYREEPGATSLTARVQAFQGALLSRAGIMFRESLDPAGKFVFVGVQEVQGILKPSTVSRPRSGARSRPSTGSLALTLPSAWLRIERNGLDFVTFASTDGQDWRQLQTITLLEPPASLLAGVAVVSEGIDTGLSLSQATVCDIDLEAGSTAARFLRGDSDANGVVNITDAVRILNSLFLGLGDIPCADAADADDSGALNITDAVRILNVLFLGVGEIPAPGTASCGVDPTTDDLGCAAPAACG
jgi:hypothetical protein